MMEKFPVLRTMTFTQLMQEMRARGFPISPEKLKKMVDLGLLPFANHIEMEKDEYIIWRKGFEEWAAEHSVMETPI